MTTTKHPEPAAASGGAGDLAARHCGPCKPGTPALTAAQVAVHLGQLAGWAVEDGQHPKLVKQYSFPDFRQALGFVNRVGEVAEQEGHHPDIELGWGRVKLTLWTHSIGGLSENDLILAAKADQVLAGG